MTDHHEAGNVIAGLAALTEWTAALSWADVSPPAQERAALILIDDFASMVAPREEPELIAYQERIARYSGKAEATVFNGGQMKLDRCSSALANGGAADWSELDGGYRPVICHAGLYCIPAILAEAESSKTATVEDVLLALVCGYETVTRIARAFRFPRVVLHPHAAFASVGAAAAIAKLRGFSAESTAQCLSAAVTLTQPGPYNHAIEGALVRNVWAGLAAKAGIYSADWHDCGIWGRAQSLVDVYRDIYQAAVNVAELDQGLGVRFAVEDGYHKLYACCQYGHSCVEATIKARANLGSHFDHERVENLHVETHPMGLTLDNEDPSTTLAAKFSLQHIVAAAVRFGNADAEAFSNSSLHDPEMTRLRRCISINSFQPQLEWPHDRPGRVTIVMADGRRETAECLSARGGPDRPLQPSEVVSKANAILAAPYPFAIERLQSFLTCNSATLKATWADTVADITRQ